MKKNTDAKLVKTMEVRKEMRTAWRIAAKVSFAEAEKAATSIMRQYGAECYLAMLNDQFNKLMKHYLLSEAARKQRVAAVNSRWCGRGPSKVVRVDEDAAALLAGVPERDRRTVASEAIRAAVAAYRAK